jgi:hypothetical protein
MVGAKGLAGVWKPRDGADDREAGSLQPDGQAAGAGEQVDAGERPLSGLDALRPQVEELVENHKM